MGSFLGFAIVKVLAPHPDGEGRHENSVGSRLVAVPETKPRYVCLRRWGGFAFSENIARAQLRDPESKQKMEGGSCLMGRYGVSAQFEQVEFLFKTNSYYTGLTSILPGLSSLFPDGTQYTNVTLIRGNNRMQTVDDFRTNLDSGRSHAVQGNFVDTRSVKQCVRNTSAGNGWNLFMSERKTIADPLAYGDLDILPEETLASLPIGDGVTEWIHEVYEGEGTHETIPELGLVDMRLDRYGTVDNMYLLHILSIRPCGSPRGTPWEVLLHTLWMWKCEST